MIFLISIYLASLAGCFAFYHRNMKSCTDFYSLWTLIWISFFPIANTFLVTLWYFDYREKRQETLRKVLDVSTIRR